MLVTQLCLTLCSLRDCSVPGSFVCGILQAGILEWVAIPFSRGSSQPKYRTWVSWIAGRFFTVWATREAQHSHRLWLSVMPFPQCPMLGNLHQRNKAMNTSRLGSNRLCLKRSGETSSKMGNWSWVWRLRRTSPGRTGKKEHSRKWQAWDNTSDLEGCKEGGRGCDKGAT